jgi:hypothetical protein
MRSAPRQKRTTGPKSRKNPPRQSHSFKFLCPRCFVDRSEVCEPPRLTKKSRRRCRRSLANSDSPRQIDGRAIEMNLQSLLFAGAFGATRRIRTDDLLITNQLLYQLS